MCIRDRCRRDPFVSSALVLPVYPCCTPVNDGLLLRTQVLPSDQLLAQRDVYKRQTSGRSLYMSFSLSCFCTPSFYSRILHYYCMFNQFGIVATNWFNLSATSWSKSEKSSEYELYDPFGEIAMSRKVQYLLYNSNATSVSYTHLARVSKPTIAAIRKPPFNMKFWRYFEIEILSSRR